MISTWRNREGTIVEVDVSRHSVAAYNQIWINMNRYIKVWDSPKTSDIKINHNNLFPLRSTNFAFAKYWDERVTEIELRWTEIV